MSSSLAVLISDIHYNITTLPVADAALRQAVAKANELSVPLIIAGDLHDTKANLRGECIKAMLDTLSKAQEPVFILRGNHDSINERSKEHSLEFLRNLTLVSIVSHPEQTGGLCLIPYEHDPEALRAYLKAIPAGSTLIMHQGINGSSAGEYIQDKSAINKEDVSDFRVISGHYHTRQDIKIGRPRKGAVGFWSYIGNPYTLNFGEADDPSKGFQILMDDGTLEFVPTNLRKHVVIEIEAHALSYAETNMQINKDDIVLVKLKGSAKELCTLIKKNVAKNLNLPADFRLDLIPTDISMTRVEITQQTQPQLLDQIIDSIASASNDQKERLKTLWKDL